MKVAILQSNYIPWKGYFDIINCVDLFIFHDDLQYTKNDWRNRNKIKTSNGLKWLTVPCGTNENRLICEVEIKDSKWQKKHWQLIYQNYHKAPCYRQYKDFFKDFYLGHTWNNLSEMNQYLIKKISSDLLGLSTKFEDSRRYNLTRKKAERVLELLKKTKAAHYLSGPAAKSYLCEKELQKYKIEIEWMDYSEYQTYKQFHPPFEHGVSIIDLIFHTGSEFREYMKSFTK